LDKLSADKNQNMRAISKYKNAQLVFIDGQTPVRIKRVIEQGGKFNYELRGSGEVLPEERLSLLKE
jgi:hypothetical protein